jgi:hypothetical protein
MGYGIEHTAELPVVGVTERTEWATLLVAALDEIRATLDAKVTPAGIDINSALSFRSGATYYGAEDLAYVSLHGAAALAAATYPGALYKNSDGELYYNDDAGNQVALTSDGSVAAAAGNLTGMTGDAAVTWVDADETFEFTVSAGTYADLKLDDLLLSDGSSNFLRLAVTGMSADYTLTLPAAVPASNNTLMTYSVAGSTVTASFSATPTVTSLTTTGAVAAGTTLAAGTSLSVGTTAVITGALTASNGIVLGADKNIVLSGTGYVRHGERVLVIPGSAFVAAENDPVASGDAERTTSGSLSLSSPLSLMWTTPILLPAGTQIKDIHWYAAHGATAGTRHYKVSRRPFGGALVNIEDESSTTTSDVVEPELSTDFTMASTNMYWLEWHTIGADSLYGVVITYDTP